MGGGLSKHYWRDNTWAGRIEWLVYVVEPNGHRIAQAAFVDERAARNYWRTIRADVPAGGVEQIADDRELMVLPRPLATVGGARRPAL